MDPARAGVWPLCVVLCWTVSSGGTFEASGVLAVLIFDMVREASSSGVVCETACSAAPHSRVACKTRGHGTRFLRGIALAPFLKAAAGTHNLDTLLV